jgi:formylglycine-generating enzyme required for sulfatase activity
MAVVAEDAAQFARWLGGELPTAKQWDKAAGRFEEQPGAGPFLTPYDLAKGEIAVGRNNPMPRGTALKDRSRFGCRDMAGNGIEWTSTMFGDDPSVRTANLNRPDAFEGICVRGRGYASPRPFHFEDAVKDGGGSLPPRDVQEHIGFRVVLELDER